MLCDLLAHWGCEAEAVTNAAEGLERLEPGAYDVLLTDFGMPGMNGVELVERARDAGVHKVLAEYSPTPKNGIVANLYDRFGLQRVEHSLSSTRYVVEPIKVQPPPAWIHLTKNKKGNAKQ